MLKKFVKCLILTAVIFTLVLPGSAFAKIGDLDSLTSGVMVIEGSYTASADGDSRIYFGPSWQTLFKIAGTNVYEKTADASAGNLATLTEDDTYFFTIVYNRNKINSYTFGNASIYINGVCVSKKWLDYTMSNQSAFTSIGDYGKTKGMQNLTISYATDDLTYVHDMAPYCASLSTDNSNILLGGKDVKGESIFGGFTANVYSDMTAGEFAQNVTASEGATLSITRGGEALSADASLQSGDVAVVTSQNGKVINEYDIKLAKLAVFSDVYSVSNTQVISGVYEFTPVNTFMNYLSIADGYTAVLKNGEDEVTSGVVSEAMTLEATSAEGDMQVYTIDIADRQTKTTVSSSAAVTFVDSIPNIDDFRGNFVIELDTTVAHGYYTGPDGNNALYVTVADEVVSLGMYKNAWSGTQPTDLTDGEELSVILVIRPVADGQNTIDYYINGNYTGTCSMNSVKSGVWTKWRVHANTSASFFKVEDEMEYLSSKGVYKINSDEDGNVCAKFVTRGTKALYLAVYDGNKLECVQIAPYNDYNFKNNTVTIPEGSEGKTVKAFLWGSKLNPLSHLTIQE